MLQYSNSLAKLGGGISVGGKLDSLDWEKVMKVILSVIAVCLVMITVKLYIPEAQAEANEMVYGDKLKRYILLNVQTFCTAEVGE